MKIGIVASEISNHPAGLERYLYELISHLINEDRKNEYVIYVKSNSKKLRHLSNDNTKIIEVGFGKFWKEIGLFLAPKSDLYIFTGPIGSLLFWPSRCITVVYDFAYKYSQNSFKNWTAGKIIDLYSWKSFFSSKKIVCISEETKKDLINFFKIRENKIRVIYPGFNKISSMIERNVKLPTGKFFLFVGTIKKRKNIHNIISGFEYFIKNCDQGVYNLVIAGKYVPDDAYYMELLRSVENNKILQGKVFFLGHIEDEELNYLYRHAISLVYPSLIEGFGLPILEAMDAGLPVITSNASSLKEVASDSAILVNPNSYKEIGDAMVKMTDEIYRNELIQKGRLNVSRFSWDKMSKEFIEVINSLL